MESNLLLERHAASPELLHVDRRRGDGLHEAVDQARHHLRPAEDLLSQQSLNPLAPSVLPTMLSLAETEA